MSTQLVTIDRAAALAGITRRAAELQLQRGRLRAVRRPSPHLANREQTMVAVDSLPPLAQDRYREEWRISRQRPLLSRMLPEAQAAREVVPVSAPVPDPASSLSEAERAWALYRYAIIEPLVTGEWARAVGRERNGVTVWSKSDYVTALAAAVWQKPNGTPVRYSIGSIYRLMARFKAGGVAALANDARSDRGTSKLHPVVQDVALAAYCSGGSAERPSLYSVRTVVTLVGEERRWRKLLYETSGAEGLMAQLDADGWPRYQDEAGAARPAEWYLLPVAHEGAIRRLLAAIPEPVREMSRRGLKRYQDHCERTSTRDYESLAAMEYVVFDHRRCDLFVAVKQRGQWKLVRPWETVAIDMRTRMVLASVMCLVPSAMSVASCIRQIVLKWGKFETAYLDNGKEFTAQFIDSQGPGEGAAWRQDWHSTEFADTRGVLAALGIKTIHAIPYSARSKMIEPFFRNPAHYERTLAGACGNRTPNRPEWLETWEQEFAQWAQGPAEVRKHPFLLWEEFRQLKDWYYFSKYNREPHTGRAMQDRSPEQVMCEEFVQRGLARTVSPRALDLLMQKRKLRECRNGGTFVLSWGAEDHSYSAPELFLYQGRQLETSYDPFDLGELNVYEPGGSYICTARADELRHMGEEGFRQDIVERARLRKQTRKAIEELHQAVHLPSPMERMRRAQAVDRAGGITGPLALPAAPPTERLDERYEQAAEAKAAAAAPAQPAEERLTFLE